ncbi:3beta-hydroxysteroid-dehydrogenase/decarboxylase isoform X2 [Carica papaya]|nr:3beta-hydroxysteroid-dehydrogenase/decarboxylase isoform X2 [Carica papaya]
MDPTDVRTHDFYHCYMIIVQGAKNVIHACRECKVKQLIYNSSADVVFDGSQDINGGDETLRYPWKFQDLLTDLKAQAEALVLFANDIDGLLTCALRPSNVFGPGDTEIVPFLVNFAKSGWAKFIIGSGENMSDFTYIENVAHANICAAEALDSKKVSVAGKAFFITNLKPMKFWDFVSNILEGLGYERPSVKLHAKMVWYILSVVMWMHEKLDLGMHNCSVSPHYIFQLALRTRTFNCSAAQELLGYSPVISQEEGLARTIESFCHLAKDSSVVRYSDFDKLSKADKLLGGGKVADILLWRDEKRTFTCFLLVVVLFYWFFLDGRTFTSSLAQLLLLVSILIYGCGMVPLNIFGFPVKSIPLSCFEVSEVGMRDSIRSIVYLWNRLAQNIAALGRGDDWNNFFKAAVSLYILTLIATQSFTVVIAVVLAFMFTGFFIYEQYESEIEGLARILVYGIIQLKGFIRRGLQLASTRFHNDE